MPKNVRKRNLPVNRFSTRSRRLIGLNIARRLPFELQITIQRAAGRAVHRALQSLVNAQIRRGAPKLKRAFRNFKSPRFYK